MAINNQERLQKLIELLNEFIEEEKDYQLVFLAVDFDGENDVIAMNVKDSEDLADMLDVLEQQYIETIQNSFDETNPEYWENRGIFLN